MLGWAIKHWKGHLYIETVSRTRKEAIDTFQTQFYLGSSARRRKEWRKQYPANKAVRVKIEQWTGH